VILHTKCNENESAARGRKVDERVICGELYGHYPTLALVGTMTELAGV
jgi:hypothetical protein